VFQEASLFKHISVRQNLEYGLKRPGKEKQPSIQSMFSNVFLGIIAAL